MHFNYNVVKQKLNSIQVHVYNDILVFHVLLRIQEYAYSSVKIKLDKLNRIIGLWNLHTFKL